MSDEKIRICKRLAEMDHYDALKAREKAKERIRQAERNAWIMMACLFAAGWVILVVGHILKDILR